MEILIMTNTFSKERPIPNIFKGIEIGTQNEVVHNRFGGGSAELPPDAVAMYDVIMGSEMLQDYGRVRAGLDWFRKFFPAEYMVLLD